MQRRECFIRYAISTTSAKVILLIHILSSGAGICAERTALTKAVVSTSWRIHHFHSNITHIPPARASLTLLPLPSILDANSQSEGTNKFLAIAVSR
jgi:hypothetical protein